MSSQQNAINDWLAQDPDTATIRQLTDLVAAAGDSPETAAELADAFAGSLQFGTAGLRGKLGPGPNRMNRVTVLRAAAGFGQYLLAQGRNGANIIIGYDARHNSDVFAQDSAEVLAGLGFKPLLFPHVVPTPVLAFAIRDQDACAGIMVTASHNPAQDNGYKVYLGDGRQIVPPSDTQIATWIERVDDVRLLVRSDAITTVDPSVIERYIGTTAALVSTGPVARADLACVSYVYTAMHGVGWNTFSGVVHAAGFLEPVAVLQQRDPDPDFPTVAFPNPEESGALDLAIRQARESGADLIVANDPDADRLAIAVVDRAGQWSMLRGDQVGVLLGWWVIKRNQLLGHALTGAFANSIVSSTLLADIAKNAGLDYAHTLTGFKWISRVPKLRFGYEEALGYCVDPEQVSDKDGISAAVLFLELFAWLKGSGQTPWDVLDELATAYGLHETAQVSVRIADVNRVKSVMAQLRDTPLKKFGDFTVTKFVDLTLGIDLPPTDGVLIELAGTDGVHWSRVIIRPSGTEPKIKCYLETVSRNSDLTGARVAVAHTLQRLAQIAEPLLTGVPQ